MSLADYTRMTGREAALDKDEVLVYTDTMAAFGADTLLLNDTSLQVKAELDELPLAPKRRDPGPADPLSGLSG